LLETNLFQLNCQTRPELTLDWKLKQESVTMVGKPILGELLASEGKAGKQTSLL